MKKLIALFLSLLMAMSLCAFAGCDFIEDDSSSDSSSISEDEGKVELMGIQATVNTELKAPSTQKISALSLTSSYTNLNVKPMHNDDELLDKTDDYLAIFKDQTIINFTIKLNNPYDFYIMDFRLAADDEEVEYYTTEGTWKSIKDRDIRWMGSDNETCTYQLRLLSPDATPSNIRIKWMYYSDKRDGRNKFTVNLNNKERYTIYKVDSDIKNTAVKFYDVINPLDGLNADRTAQLPIRFKIGAIDGASIEKVWLINGYDKNEVTAGEDGYFEGAGTISVEYSYNVKKNVTIKSKVTLSIGTLSITYPNKTSFIGKIESLGNKNFYYIYIGMDGFGTPLYTERPTMGFEYLPVGENNFYMDWKNEILVLEVPEGKDESWCQKQTFVYLGNEFNVGLLANKKYGKFAR